VEEVVEIPGRPSKIQSQNESFNENSGQKDSSHSSSML
jgi:hypothetical protein